MDVSIVNGRRGKGKTLGRVGVISKVGNRSWAKGRAVESIGMLRRAEAPLLA
jgi:hypothetical protein